MNTASNDYYAILEVPQNATLGEIRNQYKRLMRKHHPDQYNGLKAKYEKDGDKVLLRLLEEKIKESEEYCKLLNEAFKVLSTPSKRRQYDNEVVGSKVEEAKISIAPKMLSFGTLTGDQKKSASFVIRNSGGPAAIVNIDWNGAKPEWGDLIIEPDGDSVFPIKVTVSVNTKGIASGQKDERILVNVDGKVQIVDVFLSVEDLTSASLPTSRSVAGSTVPVFKKPNPAVFVGVVSMLVIAYLVARSLESLNRLQQENIQSMQATADANVRATALRATLTSMNATRTAQPTRGPAFMFSNVSLYSINQLNREQCDHWNTPLGPCSDNLSVIKFTFTAFRKVHVRAVNKAGCWHEQPENEIGSGAIWSFYDSERTFNRGDEVTLLCRMGEFENRPEYFCPLRIGDDYRTATPACPYAFMK